MSAPANTAGRAQQMVSARFVAHGLSTLQKTALTGLGGPTERGLTDLFVKHLSIYLGG